MAAAIAACTVAAGYVSLRAEGALVAECNFRVLPSYAIPRQSTP